MLNDPIMKMGIGVILILAACFVWFSLGGKQRWRMVVAVLTAASGVGLFLFGFRQAVLDGQRQSVTLNLRAGVTSIGWG